MTLSPVSYPLLNDQSWDPYSPNVSVFIGKVLQSTRRYIIQDIFLGEKGFFTFIQSLDLSVPIPLQQILLTATTLSCKKKSRRRM